MRLPWDRELENLISKPGRARTLLILSFSQHSLLFVNALILILWIWTKFYNGSTGSWVQTR